MRNSPFGYHGRYLRVDLSARSAEPVSIEEDVLRRFLGGSGLGAWLLLTEGADRQDALSPEAPLTFIFSPLVGTSLTTSAKFAVVAKSPLTERINDSLSSSHFAIAGKKTGYDAIVIVGAADRPTCVLIDPTGVRFEDASPVWGTTSKQASEMLRAQFGRKFQIATIGPAGEKLVRFATVSHDGRHAGRGGMGAVMGSKRLKAVAVCGDHLTETAHPQRVVALSKELSRKSFGPATEKYRELGTVSNLLVFNRLGTLPTRNFQQSTFEGASAVSPEKMAETHSKTRTSCAACTIGCEHIFHFPGRNDGVRMEYENLFALGPLCGISDPDTVLEASALCDELGIDTISAGASVAFAMECAERGLVQIPDLRFGDNRAMLDMLRDIGSRTGWGELFGMGTRAAAKQIGCGSEHFAPHVKGLELPGYEPRALQTMALGFAVGTRGADHNRSGAYQVDFSEAVDRLNVGPESVGMAIDTEDEAAIMDSLILCKFVRGVFTDRFAEMAHMLSLVTGWDVSASELHRMAQRIVTAKKWYNIRQGWHPDEDTLPGRMLSEQLTDGPGAGTGLSEDRLKKLIAAYNRGRGWDDAGWIPPEQLKALEIPGQDSER